MSDNIAFDEIQGLASKTLLDGPESSRFEDDSESKGVTSAIDGLQRINFEGQPDLIQCTDETISFINGPERRWVLCIGIGRVWWSKKSLIQNTTCPDHVYT